MRRRCRESWGTEAVSPTSGISAADRAIFAAIKGIPNTAPRGTRAGDFAGVNYPASDPDCWVWCRRRQFVRRGFLNLLFQRIQWTYGKCTTPKIPDIPVDITRCDEPNTWGFTLGQLSQLFLLDVAHVSFLDDGPNCSHNAVSVILR